MNKIASLVIVSQSRSSVQFTTVGRLHCAHLITSVDRYCAGDSYSGITDEIRDTGRGSETVKGTPMGAISSLKAPTNDTIPFDLIDYARDYKADIRAIFGRFATSLNLIFPNKLGLIALATQNMRRNVWRAYLSQEHLELLSWPDDQLAELRERFLHAPAQDLLTEAYGPLPQGFLRLVKKGGTDLSMKGFRALHAALSQDHINFVELHAYELSDELLDVLLALPTEIAVPRIAAQFPGKGDLDDFMALVAQLEGMEIKNARNNVYDGLMDGMTPIVAVERVMDRVRFQPPVLVAEGLTYLHSPNAMKRAARQFKNCLKDRIDEALTNDQQFYIWKGEEQVVFSIRKVTLNTWAVEEFERQDEICASVQEEDELCDILRAAGVQLDRVTLSQATRKISRMQNHLRQNRRYR